MSPDQLLINLVFPEPPCGCSLSLNSHSLVQFETLTLAMVFVDALTLHPTPVSKWLYLHQRVSPGLPSAHSPGFIHSYHTEGFGSQTLKVVVLKEYHPFAVLLCHYLV